MTSVRVEILVASYRCFFGPSEIRIDLRPGTTIALLGVNNSGKSTVLRFFYELQRHLAEIASGTWRGNGTSAEPFRTKPSEFSLEGRYGVADPLELYPMRDRDRGIRFSVNSGGNEILFEISQQDAQSPHRIAKSALSLPDNVYANGLLSRLFERILFLGPHRNIVNDGSSVRNYYGLSIGNAFVGEWDALKNGPNVEYAERAGQAEALVARLLGWGSLSINPSADRKQLYLTTTRNGRMALSEVGSGLSELVLCIVSAAIRQPSWILIDEPESHLHPALQVKFVEALEELASEGVIFTTHSIGLARTCADELLLVEKGQDSGSSIRPLDAARRYAELLGEMSYSQWHEVGYDRVLLVEGVTEIKTLRQVLRAWELDSRVMVIPLGGTALIDPAREQELAEFSRLGVPVFVLVDSERREPLKTDAQRARFIRVCQGLFGVQNAIQTERRAIENYFTQEAIDRAMRSSKYRALGPYEVSDSADGCFWGKNNNWRIAAEMTKDDWSSSDIGRLMNLVAQSAHSSSSA